MSGCHNAEPKTSEFECVLLLLLLRLVAPEADVRGSCGRRRTRVRETVIEERERGKRERERERERRREG